MTATTVSTLKVPGATLHYEVRGTGPVLLMIPGGPTDAAIFAEFGELMTDGYTVVTYDPRGHSRSPLDGAAEDIPVAVHADDASRLLASFGTEPAYVYGSSGGAVIGLELVVRHPEQVRAFVAHEPPVMELLPDSARWRDIVDDICATHRSEGVFAAMGKFGAAVEEGGPSYSDQQQQAEPTHEQAEFFERMTANAELFVAHELRQIAGYVPDIDALKASPVRIVVGGGETSGRQAAYRAAVALAERLGVDVTPFPGAHGGFDSNGAEFAARLRDALQR